MKVKKKVNCTSKTGNKKVQQSIRKWNRSRNRNRRGKSDKAVVKRYGLAERGGRRGLRAGRQVDRRLPQTHEDTELTVRHLSQKKR